MMPWPKVPLGEIIREVEAGVSVNGVDEPVSGPSEIGVMKVSCVSDGRFAASENKRVVAEEVSRVAVSPRKGDIVISRANTLSLVGASGYVEDSHPNLFLSDKLWRAVLIDSQRDNPRWLIAVLNSARVRRELARRATGTSESMKNISKESFLRIEVPRPGATAQLRLGAVFSKLEDSARQLEQLIEEKRKFKEGIAQQLLTGKQRFPKFRRRVWHASALGSHVKPISRKNTKGCKLVLTASGEHGLVDQRRYFNRGVAGSDLSKYHLIRKGEFAYNRSAMSGYPYGATKRLDEHGEGVLSTLYLCFGISDKALDSDFLKHIFESGVMNRQLRPIVRIGARAHGLLNVADDDFLSISIPFPKVDEQKEIAGILNEIEHEIDLLVDKRKQFDLYKCGLLEGLFSGKILVAT